MTRKGSFVAPGHYVHPRTRQGVPTVLSIFIVKFMADAINSFNDALNLKDLLLKRAMKAFQISQIGLSCACT